MALRVCARFHSSTVFLTELTGPHEFALGWHAGQDLLRGFDAAASSWDSVSDLVIQPVSSLPQCSDDRLIFSLDLAYPI